jgi:parvulin-like peptidyl-prolyl isomerase
MGVLVGLSLNACKKNVFVIAKIGEQKITENVLNEKLLKTPLEYQKLASTHLGRKEFINAVVKEAIIIESAKKYGVEKQIEYKNAVRDFKSEQKRQFADYKNGLLIEIYMKEIYKKIKPSNEDVLKYYKNNKYLFENPIVYTVKHIFVPDAQTAKNALERLKNCESFEKVAKEVSLYNKSTADNGFIRRFEKGDLLPEFENIILNLKNNEISKIIETSYGHHIILKLSEDKLPPISFERAKEKIRKILEKDKFDKWFAKEKEKFRVKINYNTVTADKHSK